ncbi:uncharacterized protein LOC117587727 [Drosophila guanche]|uniref:Uncharacterized protein n=1 Tax=Drosophila guanche TaxID=7266 RepID=A0A3B0JUU5_DROGU|nr:uncharacterized protein LOC117587727 [Drosophila guanche]SPP85875.1 Hypothetical predicted protein [Drosophila guanche]
MEPKAVVIAGLLQLLGVCFFFSPPKDHCSPAPTLASLMFLLAILCFLWDTCIFPIRYMHMHGYWQLPIETVMAIFLAELGSIIIWCPVERVLYGFTEALLNMVGIDGCEHSRLQYWLLGLISTAVSGALLWFILTATDSMYYLERFTRRFRRNVRQGWLMMSCYLRMSKSARCRALKVCQLATRNRSSRQSRCPATEEENDNDCYEDDE